jgi:fatty-acid desaturase
MLMGDASHDEPGVSTRYAQDLLEDPFHIWLSKYHYIPLTMTGILLLAFGGPPFFRVTVGLHATWLVNSATHLWGSRRFATRDQSQNNAW